MEYFIIGAAAFFVSWLTLFSGFGLGTILLPVFTFFFPIEIAISLTAVVHFLNNFFKLVLLGKHAERTIVIIFGLPAILAAVAGARLLVILQTLSPIVSYQMAKHYFYVTPIKLTVAVLMAGFTLLELAPFFRHLTFERRFLPLGGILSGFFGGLSGHQGALRSNFLIKCGLSKEIFIATGVVIACLVDFSRLAVYSRHFLDIYTYRIILIVAVLSAFCGTYIGNRLLKKATIGVVQAIVSILVGLIAVLLGLGVV